MDSKTRITIPSLNRELAHWAEVAKVIEGSEDGVLDMDAVRDTCEGETDLYELLIWLSEQAKLQDALGNGLKSLADDLSQRKARFAKKSDMLKTQVLQAMETAGVDTIISPALTLSVTRLAAPMVVTDEQAIPAKFWKKQDPVLDKAAVKNALKAGEDVPGALLGNKALTLAIRTK
jgi:hypothetical protein